MVGGGIEPGVRMPSGTAGRVAGGIGAPVRAGIGGVYPTVVVAPATSAVITPSFPARSFAVTRTETGFDPATLNRPSVFPATPGTSTHGGSDPATR